MKGKNIAMIAIVLLSIAVSAYAYPMLPNSIVTHWDANGNPNGYMDKFWGLSIMPAISVVLLAIFKAMPYMDPLRRNIEKFRSYFENFIIILLLFFLYVHMLTVAVNFGYEFNLNTTLIPAFSVLMYYIGVMMQHSERNWFIGVRTPWTVSSDKVWKHTHKLAAKLFKTAAVVSLVALLAPEHSTIIFLASVMISALVPVIYSYLDYKKEKTSGGS